MAEKQERGKTPRVLLQGYTLAEVHEAWEKKEGPTEETVVWIPVMGVEGGPLEAIPRDKPGRFKAVARESWQGGLEVKLPDQPQLEAIPLEGTDGG